MGKLPIIIVILTCFSFLIIQITKFKVVESSSFQNLDNGSSIEETNLFKNIHALYKNFDKQWLKADNYASPSLSLRRSKREEPNDDCKNDDINLERLLPNASQQSSAGDSINLLNGAQHMNHSLVSKINQLQEEILILKAQANSSKSELVTKTNENTSLEEQLILCNETINFTKKKVDDLTHQIQEKMSEINNIQEIMVKMGNKTKLIESQHRSNVSQIYSKIEKSQRDLILKLQKIKKESGEKSSKIVNLTGEIDILKQNISCLENEAYALKTKAKECNTEKLGLLELSQNQSLEIEKLQTNLTHCVAAKYNCLNEKSNSDNLLAEQKSEIERFVEENENKTKEIGSLQLRLFSVLNEKDVCLRENRRAIEQLTEKNSEINKLSRLINNKTSQIIVFSQELQQKNKQIVQLEIEHTHKEDKIDELEDRFSKLQVQYNELENQLTVFRSNPTLLFNVIDTNVLDNVKALVKIGVHVNNRNKNSESPLIYAATASNDNHFTLSLISYLLENGADPLARNHHGQIFLHKLFLNPNKFTAYEFDLFVKSMEDKNLTKLFDTSEFNNGTTPFMLAAKNVDILYNTLTLLKNHVNFSRIDNDKKSVLYYACDGNKSSNFLNKLVSYGAPKKYNSMELAIEKLDVSSVKVLVKLGEIVNRKCNDEYETLLIRAASLRNKEVSLQIIKILIDNGADAKVINKGNATFLHKFVTYAGFFNPSVPTPGQLNDLAVFLDSKHLLLAFNVLGNGGRMFCCTTPLQLAVRHLEVETQTLSLLQKNFLNFNLVDTDGQSIFVYAAKGKRSIQFFTKLVQFGVNWNYKNKKDKDKSLLHYAALYGNMEQIKFFVDKGLEINYVDCSFMTPLDLLLCNGKSYGGDLFRKVRYLIESGATLRNRLLDCARKIDHLIPDKTEVVKLIQRSLNTAEVIFMRFRNAKSCSNRLS